MSMDVLGSGLCDAGHHEDALSVQEAMLSMVRRLGEPEENILSVQANLARTYAKVGRPLEALCIERDIYSAHVKIHGEAHENTLISALNCASSLNRLQRFKEAKSLMRKMIPVARRVVGEYDETTIRIKWTYTLALYSDDRATLGDLHEAVTTLEDVEPIARRVFGGAHPLTKGMEESLQVARAALAARET